MEKSVVLDVGHRVFEQRVEVEHGAPRKGRVPFGNRDRKVSFDGANTKAALGFGHCEHHDESRFERGATAVAHISKRLDCIV